jgi:hypothetical protein
LAVPAPRVCTSIDCGPDFDRDALPRPLAFLSWQQALVFVLGLGIFVVLMTLSVKRPRTEASSSSGPSVTLRSAVRVPTLTKVTHR